MIISKNALVVVGGKVSVGCSVIAEAFLVPLPPPTIAGCQA